MEDSEKSSIAPSHELGLLNLITSQPLHDHSTTDEHSSTNLEQSTDETHQHSINNQTHDETNITDNLNSSHAVKHPRSGAASPSGSQSNHSVRHGSHANDQDGVDDEIQRKMIGIIQDMRSPPPTSPRSATGSRHSVTSHHSGRDENQRSSPVMQETSTKDDSHSQELLKSSPKSRTGSVQVENQIETSKTHQPVEESSSEGETMFGIKTAPSNTTNPLDESVDHEEVKKTTQPSSDDTFFDQKTKTVDHDHHSTSPNDNEASNALDETTRFDANSPKHSRSRAQSTTSRGSNRGIRDDASTYDERKIDDTQTTNQVSSPTGQDNTTASRRSSATPSVSGQVKSPTPDHNAEHSTKTEPDKISIHSTSNAHEKANETNEHAHETPTTEGKHRMSPTENISRSPVPSHHSHHDDTQHESQTAPTNTAVHSSRAPSPTKSTGHENVKSPIGSRPNSVQSKNFPMDNDVSKLIKTEEVVTVSDDQGTQHENSSLHDEHQESKNQSRPSTSDVRKSSTSHLSVKDQDDQTTKSRRESQVSYEETKIKSSVSSPRTTPTKEIVNGPSGSRRQSDAEPEGREPHQQEKSIHGSRPGSGTDHHEDNKPASSHTEHAEEHQKVHSRQPSNASQQPTQSKRSSVAEPSHEALPSQKRSSIASEHSIKVPNPNEVNEGVRSSRISSTTSGQAAASNQVSHNDEHDASHRSTPTDHSLTTNQVHSSKPGSTTHSRKGSAVEELQQATSSDGFNQVSQSTSKRNSTVTEHSTLEGPTATTEHKKSPSQRSSVVIEAPAGNKRGSDASQHLILDDHQQQSSEQNPSSRKGSTAESIKPPSSKRPSISSQTVDIHHGTKESDARSIHSERIENIDEVKPISKRSSTVEITHTGHTTDDHEGHQDVSRRTSVKSETKSVTSKRSIAADITNGEHTSVDVGAHEDVSPQSNAKAESKPASKRPSVADDPDTHQESATEEHEHVSRKSSVKDEIKPPSKRPSAANVSPVSFHEGEVERDEPASRKGSFKQESKPPSKRPSAADVSPVNFHQGEALIEQEKSTSRKSSFKQESKPSSKRPSAAELSPVHHYEGETEQNKSSSRKSSFKNDSKPSSKRPSAAEISIHHRESPVGEQKLHSRKSSSKHDNKPTSKRTSTGDISPMNYHDREVEQEKPTSRKSSFKQESKPPSKRPSASEFSPTDRKSSVKHESRKSSKSEHKTAAPLVSSRLDSDYDDGKMTSQMSTPGREYTQTSKRYSTSSDLNRLSNDDVFDDDQGSYAGASSRSNKPSTSMHHGTSSNHQNHQQQSQTVAHGGLLAALVGDSSAISSDEQEIKSSRHGSYSQAHLSRKTSEKLNGHSASPAHSTAVHNEGPSQIRQDRKSPKSTELHSRVLSQHSREPSQDMGHQQDFVTKSQDNSRRSSFNMLRSEIINQFETQRFNSGDGTANTGEVIHPTVPKREIHGSHKSEDKHSVSSQKSQNHEKRSASLKRGSGRNSTRNSSNVEETTVTPIHIESSKGNRQSSTRHSVTGSDNGSAELWKLPTVNGTSTQQNLKNKGVEGPKRSETHQSGSSQGASTSDDENKSHWTKKVPVPSIPSDVESNVSGTAGKRRPRSPNVNQIAERNQPKSPSSNKSKQNTPHDENHNRMTHTNDHESNQQQSKRSPSLESTHHIRLVDDDSLNSGSEHEETVPRNKRRVDRTGIRDMGVNTDRTYDPREDYYQLQFMPPSHRTDAYDEHAYERQKVVRATKPFSDHSHSVRRRVATKERFSTTPETIRDDDTPVVRSNTKHMKHGTEKDPVNVNVTVVVKKFSGHGSGKSTRTTTEAYVDEKSSVVTSAAPVLEHEEKSTPVETEEFQGPQAEEAQSQSYFDHVTHENNASDENLGLNSESKVEEMIVRPRSAERDTNTVSREVTYIDERHTQSDTEQVMANKQKKPKRPKRISRKCQTNENVFRRMEREQQQELRATTENEKNVQTRKSQLRPRKRSPKRTIPVFLSNDSFRAEDVLPNPYYQSRRNRSKSSAVLRTLSPPGGKLLILRPTLPFHHTDAVNVQRVCLQYAIDLIPSDQINSGSLSNRRIKTTALKTSDKFESLPMIRASSPVTNSTSAKSVTKDKSAAAKYDDHSNHRKNTGAH